MKTATLPSLRVTPELRRDAQSVLREGETLSALLETAVRQHIGYRRARDAFIARGLEAREAARASGEYASKDEVMASLQSTLDAVRSER